ncbi:acyltransferase [Alkalilimnicola ehrlichii]|uniref:Acyltransferase n=1 Tax=Alkalilimnicola ehrlichii TaxID=351052 RepID=A0A3E0WP94_9GAMM|nr:carbon-nitrogen hydrolase [Alkalilimnicola ehrlichii]RFA24559.1 acyltransferase [Alkalilimnicola ehrlichii]RFA33775.1 acyltransferase [Alkalilimnicola ehrlichii]
MTDTLRVALVQHACGDTPSTNLDRSLAGIADAAADGAQLVVLQELHRTRYLCQHEDPALFDLAEPIPGPSTQALAEAARHHGVVVVGSLFEARAPGLYHNTAVVLDSDGRLAGRYRKMHIPDDPGYYEKFYFTPGDLGFEPVETAVGRLGVLVCWDQWFPEGARLMALAGADLLLYPTAIGWDPRDDEAEKQRQREAWITIQRSHAIANGLPVLSCNRVGHEPDPSGASPGIDFWGSSFVAGPQGELLAQATPSKEQVLMADIDRKRSQSVRRIWPFLRDRRIDDYRDLLRRFRD